MVKNFSDYARAYEKRKRKTNSEKEITQHYQYMKNKSYSENKSQYDNARKEMGLTPDDNLTKSKYDSMFGSEETGDTGMYGRYQSYHQNKKEQATPKKSSLSFDQKVDKGLNSLSNFVNNVKTKVDHVNDNKLGHAYLEGVKKTAETLFAASGIKKYVKPAKLGVETEDRYVASPTRNIVNSAQNKEFQPSKDVKDAWTNKRRTSGEEIAKDMGVKSKYGAKIGGFVAEGVLDPANLVGAGAERMGAKALKNLSKVAKTTDEVSKLSKTVKQIKEITPKERNLQNIKLPNGKIEVQPTVKKSLNDLLGKTNKTISEQIEPNPVTPREVFEQQVQNSIPQVPKSLKVDEVKPVSVADNFQNAINKARETNHPQDIESIKKHTQDLIDDLDNNYKDPDTEEVKDALAKLNLQLFGGKEPVQDTLAKIEGVVERAKTLKKDIKETNPQLAKEIQGMKDINSVGKASRNLYEVVEKLPKQQQKEILQVLDKSKVDNVNYQKMYVNDLDRNVINGKTGLGIKKGSKESALVQDYGEKTLAKKELEKKGYTQEQIDKMNPEELGQLNDKILKEQHPNKYEAIKKADNFFRERYKELIDAANSTIAKIYPGQPDKLIPERSDYYHHFNEMEGLEGVINQFRTPENINPDLVTVSHGTKPKTKWQAFKQKRGLGEYKSDAVGGFLKYIQGVSHTTHVDPVIPAIRNVVKDLQNATEDSKNINNIIEALNDHADDIAGKTNPYDRTVQKILGRANLRRLNALNGRVKSNMILGNVGSTVAQVGNLPLITAKAKHHLAPGLYDTLEQFSRYATKSKKDLPINKSEFLKERFIDEDFSKFDTKILEQPKKLAVKMMTMVDKATSSLAWNSFYRQGMSKKVPNPIKYADEQTRNTLAGRGIGEMGLGQKSKTAQIFMPFTYEVGHQWKVLNDMVGKKDAAGIMTFLVTSYALNKVIEQVRGSGVSFDPIDALIDGYENGEGDKKHKVIAALGSLSGEVVGNIPGGSTVTGFAGDKNLFGSDVSLDDVFQDRNPNRFGSGLTVAKALESPSFAVLPFGANQVKKAREGYKAMKDGGVYTKNGQMMYPVDTSSKTKNAQLFTFGKYSPSEAREYFDEKRLPLSPKRTAKVQGATDKFKEYNNQQIELINNKIKRNKGNTEKLKELNKQLEKLKEKNKK